MKKMIQLTTFTLLLVGFYACTKPTKACFNISSGTILKDSVVVFDASCSKMASVYLWDFGDGSPDTITSDPVIEHLFSDVGIYTVRLHAIRKDGISFLKSKPDAEKQVIVQ
ncbi:MAG TPA: PKD domain-containing protein [Taishania sp.]|nr:PKD domain-containing protein [Taishania sp.]